MPSCTLLIDTASQVEVLFALIAAAGLYYPCRIAWGTGRTALALYRRWHGDRISVDRASYVITFAPTVVIFTLALTAALVMAIFFAMGLIGMLSAPGEPRPDNPDNTVFRWALVGGLFAVVILKNVAVAVAFRVFSWGERVFAGETLEVKS